MKYGSVLNVYNVYKIKSLNLHLCRNKQQLKLIKTLRKHGDRFL